MILPIGGLLQQVTAGVQMPITPPCSSVSWPCRSTATTEICAARPGARRENVESYVKRLENLEEISSSFEGVEQAFAVQAGREVRIMVKPDVISDDQVILLARSIAKKIEDTLDYPGQIKVNVIRESRAVEYAK